VRIVDITFVACILIAVAVVSTRDPDEPWAVAVLILALAGVAASFATWLLQRGRAARGRRAPRASNTVAGRRGLEVGAATALLLWLRAVDGLSFVTAAFVVGTFVAAELVLAARPNSSR
jgi:hypothetical protein